MKLVPMNDRVVIEYTEKEDVSPGGIIIPPTAQEKPQVGKVVAVGKGILKDGKRIPLQVKVDDLVFFSKYEGIEAEIDGMKYLIIKESEILAKLE